jgi:hypothetical protein
MKLPLLIFCAALIFACSGGPPEKTNFSGEWTLLQDKSEMGGGQGREGEQRNREGRERQEGQRNREGQGRRGGGFTAANMSINQIEKMLTISRTFVGRDEEEITREEKYNLTGKKSKNESRMGFKISGVKWEKNGLVLVINSKTNMERGEDIFTLNSTENWKLMENGTELEIESIMSTPRGDRTRTLYYTKN